MNNSTAYRRSPLGLFPNQPAPRLYDRMVEVLRTRHYSRRTAYRRAGTPACHAARSATLHWIRHFLLFHNGAHPREMAEGDVNRFLTHLAVQKNVAASTENQALAPVLFLYEHGFIWFYPGRVK